VNSFKSLLIIIFFSAVFSNDENTAKVLLKDGSEIIGIVDENYSSSQIKIKSYDGSWAHHLIPQENFFGFFDAKSENLFTMKLSYMF
tara:strand:- start:42 stop:302 length:261 start_codon:yes stop_codon:yes gene_type:complete